MAATALVAGKVHGAVAQGLGQALLECTAYDAESGQLLAGSFMDYDLPRADDMPALEIGFNPANELGVKGVAGRRRMTTGRAVQAVASA